MRRTFPRSVAGVCLPLKAELAQEKELRFVKADTVGTIRMSCHLLNVYVLLEAVVLDGRVEGA